MSGSSSRRLRRAHELPATATGIVVEAKHKYNNDFPVPEPGRHLWVVTGAWEIANPADPQMMLDTENLLSLVGPGCFVCEQYYSVEVAMKPCPGEPNPNVGWRY